MENENQRRTANKKAIQEPIYFADLAKRPTPPKAHNTHCSPPGKAEESKVQ
jgi:hypothetical protein